MIPLIALVTDISGVPGVVDVADDVEADHHGQGEHHGKCPRKAR